MQDDTEKSGRTLTQEIWKVIEYVRGASPVTEYKSLAYSLLLLRVIQSKFDTPLFELSDSSPKGFAIYISELTEYAESLLPESRGFLGRETLRSLSNRGIEGNLSAVIQFFMSVAPGNIEDDRAAMTLNELTDRFAESEIRTGGQFFTPRDVNRLIFQLGIERNPLSVCDPFAGSGETAFQFFYELSNVAITTQEINTEAYFLLLVTRFIRQIPGVDFLGDSLTHGKYSDSQYDLVVSLPPFGLRVSNARKWALLEKSFVPQDKDWISLIERLPETRSDWLIILSMLTSIKPNGRLITCSTTGLLSRGSAESDIRRRLVLTGVIETIILLPKAIHYSSAVQSVILIMRSPTNWFDGLIRFVDASLFFSPHRGRNTLEPEEIASIVEQSRVDGRCSRSVSVEEIADNEFKLDPSLYVRKTIKVSQVDLSNFRGYEEFSIRLHPRLTVIVGENGAGKTSVLEAVACGLGPFLTAMPEAKGKLLRKSDVRVGKNGLAEFTRISMHTTSSLSWDLSIKGARNFSAAGKGHSALAEYAKSIVENKLEYPIIAYFGTNRTQASASKIAIDPFEVVSRSEGYDGALEARVNYASIRNWFSKIEVDELSHRDLTKDYEFIHPVKLILVKAIKRIVANAKAVAFDKIERDILVTWTSPINGETISLTLEQLSEGNRSMLTLTIDLVRRAYQLNPQLSDPLLGEGIVLIDEIELHLHPRWQQKVLTDLTDLFPNVQFVVTTHSPQVLTTVKGANIRTVSSVDRVAGMVDSPYGAESGWVMEQVLGVGQRPRTEVSIKLEEYFELIESGRGERPESVQLRKEIFELTDGHEPMLQKADLAIKRIQWLKSKAQK